VRIYCCEVTPSSLRINVANGCIVTVGHICPTPPPLTTHPNQPSHPTHQQTRPETKYRRKLLAVCPGDELLGPASSPLRRPPPPLQLEAYLGKLRRLLEQADARRAKGAEPLEVKVAGPVQVWMDGCGWM
jgi:hypothetical protein